MGAELKKASSDNLTKAEKKLDDLNGDLKFELAQAAVDIAGIVDPTPISDIIGTGMSLYKGDFIGAGLSLISIVPYAGDALGKTAKGARAAKKINDLRKKITAAISALSTLKKAAKRKAAAAIKAKRKAEAAKKAADAKSIKGCTAPSNVYGAKTLPSKYGSWSNPKDPGHGTWKPDPDTPRGKAILEATKGKPIKFNEGYPDFTPFATKKIELDDMTGTSKDFTRANEAAGFKETPDGMTWHHHEDGVTMLLVPSKLNNNLPHTGGASLVDDAGY